MNRIPRELAEYGVQDENGATVRVSALLAERPTVLAFVRHFG